MIKHHIFGCTIMCTHLFLLIPNRFTSHHCERFLLHFKMCSVTYKPVSVKQSGLLTCRLKQKQQITTSLMFLAMTEHYNRHELQVRHCLTITIKICIVLQCFKQKKSGSMRKMEAVPTLHICSFFKKLDFSGLISPQNDARTCQLGVFVILSPIRAKNPACD